ncbi:MAG: PorV/PorQ family protein [Elusimicrobiota bacterium]|nr:PorV/PorQ family protein [Elusimicrobiota bacterium]
MLILLLFQYSFLNAGAGEFAGNEILNANPGARAMGAGGASSCLIDSLSAIQTNPAGLSYLTNPDFFTSYNQGLFNSRYAILGFAKPLPAYPAAFACSIATLQDEDIALNFTNTDGSFKETRTVKAGVDYLAVLSYSQLLGEGVSLGINAKLLQSELVEQYKATAYAGDIGLLIRPVGSRISFGLAARNFGAGLKYISEEDPLQRVRVAGVSILLLNSNERKLSIMGDYVQNETSRAHLGFEYLWRNKFALRGGYRFGYDIDTFTAGFGLNVRGIGIDYAFVNRGDFESSQVVSMRMKFGDMSSYTPGESYFNREMFGNAIDEWSQVPESDENYKKARDGINAAERYLAAEKFYKQGESFYKTENYKDALRNYEKANEAIKGYADSYDKIQKIKSLFPQTVRKAISETEKELAAAGKIGFEISKQKKIYEQSLEAYQRQDYKSAQDKVDMFWETIERDYKTESGKDIGEVKNMMDKAAGHGIAIPDSDKRFAEMQKLFTEGNYKLAKIKADEMKSVVSGKTNEKLQEIEGIAGKDSARKTGKNMAVSNFESRPPLSASEAAFITDFFRSAVVELGIFDVVDRDNMDKILAEQGFQQTGCTTEDCAVQMGKLLNVHYIAIGSCGQLLSRFIMTVNVVDVESGKIIFSANEGCDSEREIEKMALRMAEQIKSRF